MRETVGDWSAVRAGGGETEGYVSDFGWAAGRGGGEGERGATPSVRGRCRDPGIMDKVNDWFARLQPPDVPGDVP